MRLLKKLVKITAFIITGLLLLLLITIHVVFTPKSDQAILEKFEKEAVFISHQKIKTFDIRVLSNKEQIDTVLPTIVFVHGSPGSLMDYEAYFKDSLLNSTANLIAFDRVGYGQSNLTMIQNLDFEQEVLDTILGPLNLKKTIVFGYSYGGPVALGTKMNVVEVVLAAPAVYADVEPMFWFLNFYKWKVTRWLMPKMLQAASKEKLQHVEDLESQKKDWVNLKSCLTVIHGDADWIVPFENTLFLQQQFDKSSIEVKKLKGVGHELIWSDLKTIKETLLKRIEYVEG